MNRFYGGSCRHRCICCPPCQPVCPPLCPPCPPCPSVVQTYTVVYNPNGGFGGTADFNLPADSRYTIKSVAEAGVSRPGYTFLAWNTQPDGSGTLYLPGDVITITQNLILYAQWEIEPPNTVTVIYDPNGGTGGLIDADIPIGSSYTIKSQTQANVLRPEFNFVGWNTARNERGVAYAPGTTIIITQDLTLYAHWFSRPN